MNGMGGVEGGSPHHSPLPNNILDSCVLVSRQVREERQDRKTTVVTRTEFTTTHRKGLLDSEVSLTNGHGTHQESPCRVNAHSRTSSLNAPLENVGLSLLSPNSTLNRLTTKKTTTLERNTSSTTLLKNLSLMGPDGQQMQMDYGGGITRGPVGQSEYVPPTQHNQRPPHFPPEQPVPYDQDPYVYRTALPPDPPAVDESGRRYMNYGVSGGFGDYEQYPEYGNYGTYHNTGDFRPYADRPSSAHSPSDVSDSPSLTHPNRTNNSADYLRGGGYPGTYDEMDSAVPRPEYLSPSSNPHPANYAELEGGGESKGNGGMYWNASPNLNNTSHYGNLPVRAYLLSGGDVRGVEEASSSSPSSHSFHPHSHIPPQPNVPNSHSPTSPLPSSSTHHHHMHQHQDISSSGEIPHNNNNNNSNHIHNSPGVRWRDPDLHEVIQFLGNQNPIVKANAAAYLQHLCYMDDPVKAKTRALGGIPPLVALLSHEQPEVHRNSCGALRNLSYGRQNDENKKAIKSAGGIPALIRLLKRTPDNEVKELVTGVLWNLSSCEELKKAIIDDGMIALVNNIIIPHSGWERNGGVNSQHIPDACWSTVFKNSSGVVRNVSSAGEYARKKLRECEGLVEALLHVVRCALSRADMDDKSVENCVCVLRNLSYRCQEVEDPNYDKHPPPAIQSRGNASPASKGDNLGCFGANKKKKEAAMASSSPKESSNSVNSTAQPPRNATTGRTEPIRGMELLWQPEVVQSYLALLSNCSNPETLEAAAGAIQNLAACYWQPSIEIRAAVRKEKGLPVLVELLRMEVDRVVCAVATALRNLALDQRNKELIGKYAMRDLVQKLPSGRPHDQNTSDDTIAAVLATLNEVIKKNAEFSRSLMEAEGVERLVLLTQQKRRFSGRVVKFASQVLYSMWQHQELREVYKKSGWTESDFVSKGAGGRGGSPGPSGNEASSAGSPVNANSTLNRPMASQSGTRYEDKTMQRQSNNSVPKSPPPTYPQGEAVPLADMPYPDGGSHAPPGAFPMFPSQPVKPGEPLYAQVNREKKKNRPYMEGNSRGYAGYEGGAEHPHWSPNHSTPSDNIPGGDSWV